MDRQGSDSTAVRYVTLNPDSKRNGRSSFSIIATVLVVCLLGLAAWGAWLFYESEFSLEVISEGSSDISAGDHQIIYLDQVSRIRWTVAYPISEWPKPIGAVLSGVPDDIDAVILHSNDRMYFFKGDKYYRIAEDNTFVDKVGTIGVDGWYNLPSNLDGALLHSNGKAYFFKESEYYRYVDDEVDKVGTIGDDGWPGIPSNIDAVLIDDNNNVYFFKGNDFWKYGDSKVQDQGKVNSDAWAGLSGPFDAAVATDDHFFFFTGDDYWMHAYGEVGGAIGYDVLVLDEFNCQNYVNQQSFVYIEELSILNTKTSAQSKTFGVPKGDYCFVIDNTARVGADPYSRSWSQVSVAWKIEGG